MSTLRAFARLERGTTVVEFALVTPVLILILVASLDFARALNAYVTVANATREGARFATVHPDAELSAIKDSMTARIAPLDPNALTVTASYGAGASPGCPQPWPTGGIPSSAPSPVGVPVRVCASYQWNAVTWLVGGLFSGTGSRTFQMESAMVAIR